MGFRRRNIAGLLFAGLLLAAGTWSACATNPATGKSQIMLVSEQQEIEMGRKEDRNATRAFGVYDDPALQQYVSQIGLELARASERPDLPWSFKVLDDPGVNAMALPGGYVYVTRGILAHLDSEAELATVLGHEIGHVTARHSANQISKAQLANIGLAAGSIVSSEVAGISDLAQLGTSALFLKFSRDDERQADDLGLLYMTRTGYDARRSPEVFDMLDRVSQLSEGGRIPGWLSTHPQPENRAQRMASNLASLEQDFEKARIGQGDYLRQIDGLAYGPDPREGFFQDNLFVHPEMAFRVEMPRGWKGQNAKEAVGSTSPAKDAVIVLTMAEQKDAWQAVHRFAAQDGVTSTRAQKGEFNNLPAAWTYFEAFVGQNPVAGRVAFVEHRGRVFRLLGYTARSSWSGMQPTIDRALQSFAVLQDRRLLEAGAARIEVIELDRAMTVRDFHAAYPSSISLERVAVLNQADPSTRFEAGALLKRVLGGSNATR